MKFAIITSESYKGNFGGSWPSMSDLSLSFPSLQVTRLDGLSTFSVLKEKENQNQVV